MSFRQRCESFLSESAPAAGECTGTGRTVGGCGAGSNNGVLPQRHLNAARDLMTGSGQDNRTLRRFSGVGPNPGGTLPVTSSHRRGTSSVCLPAQGDGTTRSLLATGERHLRPQAPLSGGFCAIDRVRRCRLRSRRHQLFYSGSSGCCQWVVLWSQLDYPLRQFPVDESQPQVFQEGKYGVPFLLRLCGAEHPITKCRELLGQGLIFWHLGASQHCEIRLHLRHLRSRAVERNEPVLRLVNVVASSLRIELREQHHQYARSFGWAHARCLE